MFLLDTNIFDHLAKGKIILADLPMEFPILVTALQHEELARCEEPHRSYVLSLLKVLPDIQVPLETAVAGVMRAGKAKCGDGHVYDQILPRLRRRKSGAHIRDALLAEVAIKQGYVLLTNDQELAGVVKELGGYVRMISFNRS